MTTRYLVVALVSALGLGVWSGCSDGGGGSLNRQGGNLPPGNPGPGGNGVNPGGPGGPGPGGGPPPDGGAPVVDAGPMMTAAQAMAEVGGCFTYADFVSTGLIDMPKSQTFTSGPCLSCHAHGEASFWASWGTVSGVDTSMQMFQMTQMMPYVAMYIAPTITNGVFTDLAASGTIANKANLAAQCVPSAQNNNWCHPTFAFEPQVQTSIDQFTAAALMRWHSHTCAAPPPADAGAPPTDAGDGGG